MTPRQKQIRYARLQRYRATPRGKFIDHKQRARQRGVPFLLTFDDWFEIWRESGKWDERGRDEGGYVMRRINDAGAYAKGNVYIGLHAENVAERNTLYARKHHTAKTTTVTFHTPEVDADRSIYGAITAPF